MLFCSQFPCSNYLFGGLGLRVRARVSVGVMVRVSKLLGSNINYTTQKEVRLGTQ